MFYIVSWLFWGGMCGIVLSILFYSQLQPYYEASLHKMFQMVEQIAKGNGIYIQSCFLYQIKKWMLLVLFSGVAYFLVMYFCYFFFKGMMRGLVLGTLLQKCGIKGIMFWGRILQSIFEVANCDFKFTICVLILRSQTVTSNSIIVFLLVLLPKLLLIQNLILYQPWNILRRLSSTRFPLFHRSKWYLKMFCKLFSIQTGLCSQSMYFLT